MRPSPRSWPLRREVTAPESSLWVSLSSRILIGAVALVAMLGGVGSADALWYSSRRYPRIPKIDYSRILRNLKSLESLRRSLRNTRFGRWYGRGSRGRRRRRTPGRARPWRRRRVLAPLPTEPLARARERCRRFKCGKGLDELAARRPLGAAEKALLRELLPQGIRNHVNTGKRASARRLIALAREIGAQGIEEAWWEQKLKRGALADLFGLRAAYAERSILGDRVQPRGLSDGERILEKDHEGIEWYRVSPRNGKPFYFLASALTSSRYGVRIGQPGFFDRLHYLRSFDLPFKEVSRYWRKLLFDPLAPWALALLIYLVLTLWFAPRFTGKFFDWVGLRWVALHLYRFACHRLSGGHPRRLAGSAVDLARTVIRRVRRPITRTRRERLLQMAELSLTHAAYLSPKARAWLGRLYFVRGDLMLAEEALRESLRSKASAFARIELARVLVALGRTNAAAEQLASVPRWRTLSAESMLLRAIAAAHAGRISEARWWLLGARRSRDVRNRSDILAAALREAMRRESAARAAAQRAVRRGVGVRAAALWLSRRPGTRGASGWLERALEIAPHDVELRVEARVSEAADLGDLVKIAKRFPSSRRAVGAALERAVDANASDPWVDELVSREGGPSGLNEQMGDYAIRRGHKALAVRLWASAAQTDPTLRPLLEARCALLAAEALAAGEPEQALSIADAGGLQGAERDRFARYALRDDLDRARRGLVTRSLDPRGGGTPVERALAHLLRGERDAAATALEDASELGPSELGRLRHLLREHRPLTDIERRDEIAVRWIRQNRATPVRQAWADFRTALEEKRWGDAGMYLAHFRYVLTTAPQSLAALDAILAIANRLPDEMPGALEELGRSHPDALVRALAAHDRAVALSEGLTSGAQTARRRRWAEAWNDVLGRDAYRAHLMRRILEIGDPRLRAEDLDGVIDEIVRLRATEMLPALRRWMEEGGEVPTWISEGRVGSRAARIIHDEMSAAIEVILERLEAARGQGGGPSEAWNLEGERLLEKLSGLRALGVEPVRVAALQRRACSTMVNLGVEADGQGDRELAVRITELAVPHANTDHLKQICLHNLTHFRSAAPSVG